LPQVLARLARSSGRAAGLLPIWEAAVGPSIARNARPHTLRDGVLAIRVQGARWAHELTRCEPELRRKLDQALGPGMVKRLEFLLDA
jgi:predicted nucleic acid-binding Zn ribbon protein